MEKTENSPYREKTWGTTARTCIVLFSHDIVYKCTKFELSSYHRTLDIQVFKKTLFRPWCACAAFFENRTMRSPTRFIRGTTCESLVDIDPVDAEIEGVPEVK